MTARVFVMAMMLSVFGVPADAQELVGDLTLLRELAKPGNALTITDTAGQRVQGTLSPFTATGILLALPDGQRRQFDGAMTEAVAQPGRATAPIKSASSCRRPMAPKVERPPIHYRFRRGRGSTWPPHGRPACSGSS
jgi:hypothetical protein